MSVKLRSDLGYAFTGFAYPFLSDGVVVGIFFTSEIFKC